MPRDEELWTRVLEHLPLVSRIASKFRSSRGSFSDLRAEGVLGLVEAALRFDPAQGAAFETYASFWVRKRIREAALRESWFVRVSNYRLDRLARIRAAERDLSAELGRRPSDEETAARAGVDPDALREARSGIPRHTSLDDRLGPDSERRLAETLAQTSEPDPYESAEKESALRFLRVRLGSLPPRERDILRLHFGLDGGEPRPLGAIAHRYGLSRERVHQIERAALERLRRWIDRPSPLPPA